MVPIDLEKLRREPRCIASLTPRQINEAKKQAFKARVDRFGSVLHCHAPGFSGIPYGTESFVASRGVFESISITGASCMLQCDHCRGHLLQTMRHANPGNFEGVLRAVIASGATGVLVSGGSGKDGKVPIRPCIDVLRLAKKQHDIDVVIHSGLMDDDEIHALRGTGIDGVMFDFPGSAETIKAVCHLDTVPEDYARMVTTCKENGIPVMPHVIIGLDWGKIKGELDALSMLGKLKPDVLVIVILMPFPGTPMADVVPDIDQVEIMVLAARILNPDIPVQLGCAKPQGDFKERVERFAVECGFNGIAYPIEETVARARELGLEPVFHGDCCSLVAKHMREARS
ncbi:MAG: radical SAM protein [Candidatus Sigynarchaeota archaeon]